MISYHRPWSFEESETDVKEGYTEMNRTCTLIEASRTMYAFIIMYFVHQRHWSYVIKMIPNHDSIKIIVKWIRLMSDVVFLSVAAGQVC